MLFLPLGQLLASCHMTMLPSCNSLQNPFTNPGRSLPPVCGLAPLPSPLPHAPMHLVGRLWPSTAGLGLLGVLLVPGLLLLGHLGLACVGLGLQRAEYQVASAPMGGKGAH